PLVTFAYAGPRSYTRRPLVTVFARSKAPPSWATRAGQSRRSGASLAPPRAPCAGAFPVVRRFTTSLAQRERRDMADKPVRADKATAVAELTEQFRASSATVLTEYRGLTVAQLKELRRSLGRQTTYAVAKNTLAKR